MKDAIEWSDRHAICASPLIVLHLDGEIYKGAFTGESQDGPTLAIPDLNYTAQMSWMEALELHARNYRDNKPVPVTDLPRPQRFVVLDGGYGGES